MISMGDKNLNYVSRQTVFLFLHLCKKVVSFKKAYF